MELQVNGRLRQPMADAWPREDGVTIRVDDAHNAEFWLEVFVSLDQLKRMVAAVEEERRLAPPIGLADLIEEPVEPVEDIPPVLDDATWTGGL